MTAPRREDWRRVREVFEAALAQPAVYRQPFVAEACRGEPGIYDQVIGLLASHDSAATFLETPAARLLDDGPWADLAGQRIGPYHLEARIGGGGMGEVFRARDTRLDRLVALKLIAWPAAPDAEVRRRFEREARAIAKLNHPNICVLYDVGQHKDADFLVMEYLQGETLAELLTRGPLAPELLRQCAVGIADALDFAHRHHIIHRDLKPSNIIVTESGAKLLDFGIAKLLHRDNEADTDAPVVADATLTQRGRIVGTVAYMSPEQVRGEAIDGRSDLFSFGAVLYEMATGRRRFPGAHTSAVSEAILTGAEDGADPTAVVSGPIGDIIRKALRAERTQRYQRAREIKADLLALEPEDRAPLREQRKPSWVSKAAAVLLAALVLVVSLWLAIDRRSPVATVTAPPSVAVLPFKPLVPGAPDDAYLGLGLAEALITELGTFRTIAVRPVTATSHYGPNRNPVAAGRELGTDLVLDGALQRSADRLRINVSLVRVADGLTVWADRFDVQWTDVFRVQDAIAEQVGRALPAALSGEDRERMVRRRTDNAAAYEAYLKGRYFWSMRTVDALQRAQSYFQQAIAQDRAYAPAYAGLADTFQLLGSMPYAVMPASEAADKARDAAHTALEIDDTLAEAHTSLAFVTYAFDWQWAAGEREFQRAIALDPTYLTARLWYGGYLALVGRVDEGIAEAERGRALDPLSLIGTYQVGLVNYLGRRYDVAAEFARKSLEIDPRFPSGRRLLGQVYAAQGRHSDALVEFQRLNETSRGNWLHLALLAQAYGRTNDSRKAREMLDGMITASKMRFVPPAQIAIGYLGLDDRDAAFAWLERAYAEHSQVLTFLKMDPMFDPLRSDPRYADLIRRIGLTP